MTRQRVDNGLALELSMCTIHHVLPVDLALLANPLWGLRRTGAVPTLAVKVGTVDLTTVAALLHCNSAIGVGAGPVLAGPLFRRFIISKIKM